MQQGSAGATGVEETEYGKNGWADRCGYAISGKETGEDLAALIKGSENASIRSTVCIPAHKRLHDLFSAWVQKEAYE